MLVGAGARDARAEVLALAERLSAPMVLTLKAKEGLERDNPFEVGQSGLIGNPAARQRLRRLRPAAHGRHRLPLQGVLPGREDRRADRRPRRAHRPADPVDHALVGDARGTLAALLPLLEAKADTRHLDQARASYEGWRERQRALADPDYERQAVGRLRRKVDNPEDRIRPELLAAASTGTPPTTRSSPPTPDGDHLAVAVRRMRGGRRLLGSFNLGSMANAMPQALGAQALDRDRQVVAFCGDGGLSMLLGDLITAVTHDLPVKLVVFDNGRLGMVKLEMEQVGLPQYGTVLDNPDFAAVPRRSG